MSKMTHTLTVPLRAKGMRLVRESVGHNRREAERRLRAIQVEIDQDSYAPRQNVTFSEWAEDWLAGLRREKTSATRTAPGFSYAKQVIGRKPLRKVTTSDVRAFLDHIERANRSRKRARGLADHARKAPTPPRRVPPGGKGRTPDRRKPRSAASTEREAEGAEEAAELLHKRRTRPAVARANRSPDNLLSLPRRRRDGVRIGELAAVRWDEVNLLDGEIVVSRTYAPGFGESSTKSGQPRTMDLTPQAKRLLEEWYPRTSGEGLVFQRDEGSYLNGRAGLKALYAAMARADIPRVGERGGKRTFHSFRNTFARIALEGGAQLTWVQVQLGHSSITLTRDVYGAWSRRAEKLEAQRRDGAFTV